MSTTGFSFIRYVFRAPVAYLNLVWLLVDVSSLKGVSKVMYMKPYNLPDSPDESLCSLTEFKLHTLMASDIVNKRLDLACVIIHSHYCCSFQMLSLKFDYLGICPALTKVLAIACCRDLIRGA